MCISIDKFSRSFVGSLSMVGERGNGKASVAGSHLNVTSTIFAKFCSNKDIVIAKWTETSLHLFTL